MSSLFITHGEPCDSFEGLTVKITGESWIGFDSDGYLADMGRRDDEQDWEWVPPPPNPERRPRARRS